MLTGIVIGSIGGFVAGSIYGKLILSEGKSIKAHVTAEVASIKTAIATEFASFRKAL